MAEVPIDLHGAPQTALATLYAKALDADAPYPVLGDRDAKDVVSRIDYDWPATTIDERRAPSVTVRATHFDTWVRQFLAVHSAAVVLDLGCGLDTRYLRIDPGPNVEWYDVDYPEIADLRRQLLPAGAHNHIVGASVTDPTWLAGIPADRPTLMIGEGLTMYLTRDDGLALLRRIVDHFPCGELQFDAFNRLAIRTQWTNAVVRRSGATLYWSIDGPDDILAAVPGLRLLAWVPVFESDVFDRLPRLHRVMGAVMGRVPGLRTMAQFHRYAF